MASYNLPDAVHMASDEGGGVVTTIFISNLHCSSCVRTIEETLGSLSPLPSSVHVSVVSQSVTVHHSAGLSPLALIAAIEEAGFDLAASPVAGPSQLPDIRARTTSFLSLQRTRHVQQCSACQQTVSEEPVPEDKAYFSPLDDQDGPYILTLSVGGMTCSSCTGAITNAVSEIPGIQDVAVSLLSHSATAVLKHKDLTTQVVETIEDIGYEAEVVDTRPARLQTAPVTEISERFLLTLSIGGMTCVSCSSTITRLVSEMKGVSEVSINLLGNSGSMVIERKGLLDGIVDAIESAGYEATVMDLEPFKSSNDKARTQREPRSISLRVEGMFCEHCPDKVDNAIKQLDPGIAVEKLSSGHRDPIFRVTYTPSVPTLTIRDIVAAAESANSPPFHVSLHKPASLEERARAMQMHEQHAFLYRLVYAVIVAIPTFIIGIVYMSLVPSTSSGKMFLMEPMWSGNASRIQWSLFFLATPVMFYSAGIFHRRSLKEIHALWRRSSKTPVLKRFIRFGSMNLLVSSGVSVAYFSSIILLALAASTAPSPDGHGDTTTYFDSVVFLTMFLLIGRYMEAYSKGRTADAITSLGKLRPSEARLLVARSKIDSPPSYSQSEDDVEKGILALEMEDPATPGFTTVTVSVDMLEIGDVVRVQNGSTPPADGTIISGKTTFNESSLTGESRLIKKTVGDEVFLGTINNSRSVDVRIGAIGGQTMLDYIVKVVRDGQTKRAPIERVADLLTGYFVPVVTLLAILTWVIWLGLGLGGVLPRDYLDNDVGGWPIWSLEFAIAVFVVACPCGIGLAAPTALLVGSGLAAKFGILARGGGEAFQEAAQLDAIVFDKTGTLTQGDAPRVTDAEVMSDDSPWPRDVLLGIAAELESASTHPLATAIRLHCGESGAAPSTGTDFEESAGRGLRARFDARQCTAIIGNEKWMEEHGAAVEVSASDHLEAWKLEGKSVMLLALREDVAGTSPSAAPYKIFALFAVADPVRPNARVVVSRLQSQGLATWMITGDNLKTAQAVANSVGIPSENVIAEVLPHEKAQKIQWLQQVGVKKQSSRWHGIFGKRLNERCIVAMIGDGINDAPALAAADVAIAVGSGSDIALSSASFILVSSDLQCLLTLVDLARTVFRRVKFNFLWAVMYNTAALPIAAGVIYPAGHARLGPVWGSLAMALSSVSVVCSSLALKLYRPSRK